ncbi:MAG TPA: orotidine-5'-phosphate decarboxylase [Limnochordales bacterium]|nr:orotidine-5'-phosphate decarboxylase [Limnochordales bacterium]
MRGIPPFPARVLAAVAQKGGPVVVGLDPRPELLPPDLMNWGRRQSDDPRQAAARAVAAFNRLIIDAVHDIAVAVKPQLAFFEQLGWPGLQALEETIAYAREQGLLVIVDGKRNDIGSTAAAYARAYLGGPGPEPAPVAAAPAGAGGQAGGWQGCPSGLEADALTVNPYLGSDSMAPFLEACRKGGKGVFVLVRTSNPSGAELQDLPVDPGPGTSPGHGDPPVTLAQRVAQLVVQWNQGMPRADGYGPVGAVVGATGPEELARLRRQMPGVLLLVPGYGAQGAGAREAAAAFAADGRGALVNSARDILYAWRRERPGEPGTAEDYAAAARRAALRMRDELQAVLGQSRQDQD